MCKQSSVRIPSMISYVISVNAAYKTTQNFENLSVNQKQDSQRKQAKTSTSLRIVLCFEKPVARVKMKTTSKNTQRHYTPKNLTSQLLSSGFILLEFISKIFEHLRTNTILELYANVQQIVFSFVESFLL